MKERASVEVNGPPGMIIVAMPPASYLQGQYSRKYRESFEVEKGTASRMFFKGFGPLKKDVELDVKALKRGIYNFGAINYAYHGLMSSDVREEARDSGLKLVVMPRYKLARKASWNIEPSSTSPRVTPNRLGPYSTNFVSVREYVTGDPFKFINWKATARSANGKILVNEFEREGLRNVIFVVDVGRWMRLGLSQENSLEKGIPLVLSLSKALLEYGYNVGLWTAPPTGVSVMPSSGQTQFQRILNALLQVSYWEEKGIRMEELFALRRVVAETNAMLIVITNLAESDVITSLCNTICIGNWTLGRTLIIDVIHTSIIVRKELEAEFPGLEIPSMAPDRRKIYSAIPKGARVISWDPEIRSIGEIMRETMGIVGWLS